MEVPEDDHDSGKDHQVTHYATLDETGNSTTSATEPRTDCGGTGLPF